MQEKEKRFVDMKAKYRVMGVAAVCWGLVFLTGCVGPDGHVDKTATGALAGAAFGAFLGAAGGGKYAGERALIGAAIGAGTGALIGHMITEDERARLREESPQTLQTIDQNDEITQQEAAAGQQPEPGQSAASAPEPTPLKESDIEALTKAGVKPDAIINAIKESQAPPYAAADIQAAQQANPPVDPSVIAYMENPTG
jgi:outer membrane lipoprotein SlyB